MSDMDVMACHSETSDGDMRNPQHAWNVGQTKGRHVAPHDLLVPEGDTWTRTEYYEALAELEGKRS